MDYSKSNRQILYDLFQAYYDARKHKRNSLNVLRFEANLETNLFKLYEEIINGQYQPGKSICFVVKKPVLREVFAADFRDRIIHHLIFNYINPIVERQFILDSYSCRTGKGVAFGIKRLNHFIRSCSKNYSRDCYILKLDIKGYFMAMDRQILYQEVKQRLVGKKQVLQFNLNLVLSLIQKVIFNDPTKKCIIKGSQCDWQDLPKSKSLFWAGLNKGFPIGNLTSQLFGNIYLNDFDHFVKYQLGFQYYGRYVDDLILVHQDKKYLKKTITLIRYYLKNNLGLKLHDKKIYLQPYQKGIKFLGIIIKPYRTYLGNRTKNNFYQSICFWNYHLQNQNYRIDRLTAKKMLSSINSYLGIAKHYQTYRLRQKMLFRLSGCFWNIFYISGGYTKLALKCKLNPSF